MDTTTFEGIVYDPDLDCGHAGVDIQQPKELGEVGIQRLLLRYADRRVRVTIEDLTEVPVEPVDEVSDPGL
jgi:hypothetical protein